VPPALLRSFALETGQPCLEIDEILSKLFELVTHPPLLGCGAVPERSQRLADSASDAAVDLRVQAAPEAGSRSRVADRLDRADDRHPEMGIRVVEQVLEVLPRLSIVG
jgi:hypothetical protein